VRLRADHVAGAAFVAFGLLIIAASGDLPMGSLSFPASGFMPKILAGLMIVFGGALIVRAGETPPLATIDASDLKHAGPVVIITALATASYEWLGFVLTFVLMMLAILVLTERRNVVRAVLYSVATTGLTYVVFVYGLKAPLPTGPLGF
jgi:hypothetical protein